MIENNPNFVDAWFYKGNAFILLGNYEGALEAYDTAIKIDPKHYMWRNKGTVLLFLYKFVEAIEAFDVAIEINPQDDESWNNKGRDK